MKRIAITIYYSADITDEEFEALENGDLEGSDIEDRMFENCDWEEI